MEDRLRLFLQSLEKQKIKKAGLGIKPISFEEFEVTMKKKGGHVGSVAVLNMAGMADLYKWIKLTLNQRAYQIEFFATYHPDSPHYWLRDVGVGEAREEGEPEMYTVGLDLEDFMESGERKKQKEKIKVMGSFIPDNYELAKKVAKAFNRETGNKRKFADISFRETAMWESADASVMKDLGDFIQRKYVTPRLEESMESFNASGVTFTDKQIEFINK